ncbi:MAG: UDP-N-acetylglucosamine--N-acetylmuramyl-(pentapeptide) pyrophosphoryl-undecaprenol N-acetylglucosamine transferase [Bacteriovoracaceae bacterium]|nr:UDP-N-acetylglucosamine--N-acetylmuramyl-(pentapeptide) pyrophosphoryl-undecaprenol N-acetylglucosamine transferase [Bacteriovoracaceae bacterium]
MKKNYVFTGGGSGGHTIPALTIFRSLDKNQINVTYYGSYSGIESEIIPKEKIKYRKIFTGKLRRYLTWRHFPDFLKFFLGIAQSTFYLMADRPQVVFSTGGFVSLPVVISAWVLQIKVVIHEQTSRVGLANRIAARFADKVLISFEASRSYFPAHKVEWTGYPLRPSLFTPVNTHFEIQGTDFSLLKLPILLFMGGGNGAKLINDFVNKNFFELIKHHHVVLQCGSMFWNDWRDRVHPHFTAFTFLGNELVELMKMSQVMVARAGAGTVCEVIALQKPAIFIPLKIAQKNEQYHNAIEAKNLIGSEVILEDEFLKITLADFFKHVEQVQTSSKNISKTTPHDATSRIVKYL